MMPTKTVDTSRWSLQGTGMFITRQVQLFDGDDNNNVVSVVTLMLVTSVRRQRR